MKHVIGVIGSVMVATAISRMGGDVWDVMLVVAGITFMSSTFPSREG